MKYFLSLLLFITSPIVAQEFKYNLCVCTIFQNDADFMEEWVSYHWDRGVDHFYLYNNNSTDDYEDALSMWIDNGVVEIIQWPSTQEENDWYHFSFTIQTGSYNDCINRTKGITKWLALIDTDEFILPIKYRSIIELLEKDYPEVSGLCVNWQCYGTSGVTLNPGESMLENLKMKMKWDHEWNKHSKTICQPLHTSHSPNPHYCLYLDNHWAIDANGNRCDVCPDGVYIDKIRLNHYWTRDENYLNNVKIPRYLKWGNSIDGILEHSNKMNQTYDPILSNQLLLH